MSTPYLDDLVVSIYSGFHARAMPAHTTVAEDTVVGDP